MGWRIKPIPVLNKQRLTWFWEKVQKGGPDDCWVWTAFLNPEGYGQFCVGNGHCMAHRIAWFLANGPIPEGLMVCHSCDNPRCCNPQHLWLGSQKHNLEDMTQKGRRRGPVGEFHNSRTKPETIPRGEHHPHAKLTLSKVLRIRELVEMGYTQHRVADLFSVNQGTISCVVNRTTWRHVL